LREVRIQSPTKLYAAEHSVTVGEFGCERCFCLDRRSRFPRVVKLVDGLYESASRIFVEAAIALVLRFRFEVSNLLQQVAHEASLKLRRSEFSQLNLYFVYILLDTRVSLIFDFRKILKNSFTQPQ
jgi:hypothetical protein